ncbi:hypothetical protein AVEN_183786-1 [Araneus ventricosus]|uniref:Uncharacterized protein n=1 Tax=Araneus ventricosus TaxID=182803 RepID=A0A4Y2MWC6_ARAVE|nr:hypothetical protein AVEN_183786-1 [Araneus ventricosus]
MCNKPTYAAGLQWNLVSSRVPYNHEAETLPLSHHDSFFGFGTGRLQVRFHYRSTVCVGSEHNKEDVEGEALVWRVNLKNGRQLRFIFSPPSHDSKFRSSFGNSPRVALTL